MGFFLSLYNLILLPCMIIGSPVWIVYLMMVPKARAGFWQKLGIYDAALREKVLQGDTGKRRLWFHAVSVGEFNAIRPLVTDLQGDYDVVITTTTRTGQDLAKRVFPELPVLYFPFDIRPVIRKAIRLIRPDLVLLTETELWPNFIDMVTRQHRTPMVLINGRLSPQSFKGYQWIRPLIKPTLRQLTHLYMQAQGDAERVNQLAHLPPEQITVAGNIKFDLFPEIDPIQRNILAHLLNIAPGEDTVLVFASTHSGEDGPLLDAYAALKKDFPELRLVLAPRHPERVPEIKNILSSKALHFSLRSQLTEENPNRQPVVVLDSIGELMIVYSFATLAVMGGSFIERGGQNPLEPISQRIPVIFGPHMENFSEISRMILENHAGYQVSSTQQLGDVATELLTQPEIYSTIVENGQQLLENNRGAKELIIQGIRSLVH